MSSTFSREGQIVDVVSGSVFPGRVTVRDGRILSVEKAPVDSQAFILPGLVDAHIHIESSMLVPSSFARLALIHGTTATVSDPHEIANVLGVAGVEFMIENGKKVPFKFHFGAPSCVPATMFESAGAILNVHIVNELLKRDDIYFLSEMMNFPGVLSGDEEVKQKIASAIKYGKPVDGHAPGLDETAIRNYASAGITTDHECVTYEEGVQKIKSGMHVLIREGSAAKNFDALIPLISTYPENIMMCSDDLHPDDLLQGHINLLIRRAISLGYRAMDVIRACTLNPVKHFNLDCGLLQSGDAADMIVVDALESFNVLETFVNGELLATNGISHVPHQLTTCPNVFNAKKLNICDIGVKAQMGNIKVIQAFDGDLLTRHLSEEPKISRGQVVADIENDILKICVINRYQLSDPVVGFIKGFGLKKGALASTVAHDSHNLICVGTNDADMITAIHAISESGGGIAVADGEKCEMLTLPVAGLMSDADAFLVAAEYENINKNAVALGSNLHAPFMTLSFMALLVIPELKISDKGLFDGTKFDFVSLFDSH